MMVVSSFQGCQRGVRHGERFPLRAAGWRLHPQRPVAFRAQAELEVGGIVIGDVPSYRADQMPYGGVKNSGSGLKGIASAIRGITPTSG